MYIGKVVLMGRYVTRMITHDEYKSTGYLNEWIWGEGGEDIIIQKRSIPSFTAAEKEEYIWKIFRIHTVNDALKWKSCQEQISILLTVDERIS